MSSNLELRLTTNRAAPTTFERGAEEAKIIMKALDRIGRGLARDPEVRFELFKVLYGAESGPNVSKDTARTLVEAFCAVDA